MPFRCNAFMDALQRKGIYVSHPHGMPLTIPPEPYPQTRNNHFPSIYPETYSANYNIRPYEK